MTSTVRPRAISLRKSFSTSLISNVSTVNAPPTHLQPPVEGFWYGDTGGLSRAVRRDRRDEGVQLVPGETRETYLFISADFNFRDLSPLRAKCNLTKFYVNARCPAKCKSGPERLRDPRIWPPARPDNVTITQPFRKRFAARTFEALLTFSP